MFELKEKMNLFLCKLFCRFDKGVSGIGVIEIILILVVLIGLVLIFKQQLTSILNSLFRNIKSDIQTL